MNKIPTIFVRDWENDPSRVTKVWNAEALWLLQNPHAAFATVKKDGTNVRVTLDNGHVSLEKRRNPSKKEKTRAHESGLPDPEPTYVDAVASDPANKHIWAAVYDTDFSDWPDGVFECEALGPKIQGGVESDTPQLYPFSFNPEIIHDDPLVSINPAELTPTKAYYAIGSFLQTTPIEGIVWYGAGGKFAKIKRRDFGLPWPP